MNLLSDIKLGKEIIMFGDVAIESINFTNRKDLIRLSTKIFINQ